MAFGEDDMIRYLAIAALLAVGFAGGAAAEGSLCKDQCIKSCMGNDTPTERANCLAREKCDNRPACPTGGIGGSAGMYFEADPAPPRPGLRLPKVLRSDMVIQSLGQ
jgi:hypothetical protein